ncbi:MAG TPA: terminase TerL endonuclease subunit [Devosiaceae bacterium]|jgi:phage terminase large subunit-like protein
MKTTRPDWVFDDSEIPDPLGHGERAVRFFDEIRHPLSGDSERRFGLPRFWERIIRRIYGPRHPDGRRIVRTVFIMIPRGARKTTTIGGGLGLLHAIGHEKVPSGQVLLGAGSEDQAELAFDEAVSMVRATPFLCDKVKIRGTYLEHPTAHSKLAMLSAEGDTAHGKTPAAVFLDELHVFKNRKLWRALKTGMLKSKGSLLCITTTAGRGQTGLAWEEYQFARRVALREVDMPHYLPVIFEPSSPDADWLDEELWHQVNPGLVEGFPVLEEMRAAAMEAKEKPTEADEFKQYNLNFWLDSATSPFVEMAVYDVGAKPFDLADMEGLPCWIGVDLSSTTDLTAVVAVWRDGERYFVQPYFFCPADNLEQRETVSQAPYRRWVEEGLVTATPGTVVDYDAVTARIIELAARFDVREVAFDPKFARQVQPRVMEAGIAVVDHPQQSRFMIPAIAALERAILSRNMIHGGHEVLRFNFENVNVRTDLEGHKVALMKSKRYLSIDGAQATAMAVSRASEYETTGWLDTVDVDAFFDDLNGTA